ncbi:MAG: hypothetical protein AAF903_15135 [Pseudomonadota bacterium]
MVEGFDLSVERQDELIHTVWNVMENAIDRAWRDDPVQVALASKDAPATEGDLREGPVVDLGKDEYRTKTLRETFNKNKDGG